TQVMRTSPRRYRFMGFSLEPTLAILQSSRGPMARIFRLLHRCYSVDGEFLAKCSSPSVPHSQPAVRGLQFVVAKEANDDVHPHDNCTRCSHAVHPDLLCASSIFATTGRAACYVYCDTSPAR